MLPVLIIVILSSCLSYSWTLSRADAVAIELTTEERSDTKKTRHGEYSGAKTVSQAHNHRRKLLLDPGAQATPHFYDHGARPYNELPNFCDVILSKLCFNCSHWFYAMPTNRQLDHSFPAVLDIFGKGLNLPAPLDIQ